MPYKLILGNFIEAIDGGADYVSMITSPGCCRLGEYGKSINNALKDLNMGNKYIELELYDGLKGMYNYLKILHPSNNPIPKIQAILIAMFKVFAMDELEDFLSYHRAREVNFGDSEKAFLKGRKLIESANTLGELRKAKKEALRLISNIKIDKNKDVLHVDLTGEIFLVLDQFSNQNISRELGKMGVQVRRSLTVSGFLKDAIIPKMFKKGETVVYGSQGVCEINDICIMNFGKMEGEYYMLKPVYDENSTIYVPVDNDLVTSRMQRLITKEELESLIADVRSEKTDWICNDLERKAFCEAVISSGDRKALMKLIGMLYVRKNSLKTQKKHFHLADEKLLKEAEKIISDEIAYVTGIDRNKVSDYVSERIMHGQRAFIGE